MIIIGYPGIGKSTIAADKFNKVIDLESSLFKGQLNLYCSLAEELSKQGFVVFVSSHPEVREILRSSDEHVEIILPIKQLKLDWQEKLRERYDNNPSEKNKRAFNRVLEFYTDDIEELENDVFRKNYITTMEYDLKRMLEIINECGRYYRGSAYNLFD